MKTLMLSLLLTCYVSLFSQNGNIQTTEAEIAHFKNDGVENRRNLRFPIINHDALWYSVTVGEGPVWEREYSFLYFDKDSVEIDGKYYFPLMQAFETGNKPPQMRGYFRDEGSITYKYVNENSPEYQYNDFSIGEYVYFDFAAAPGEPLVDFSGHNLNPMLQQVEITTDMDGDERIQLSIACSAGGAENFVIEGIGDEIDGLFGPYWYCTTSHYVPWLVCYSENNVVKYKATGLDDYCMTTVSTSEHFNYNIKVFPNPTAGFINVHGVKEKTELNIYNIQGAKLWTRMLNQDEHIDLGFLSNGIYIAELRQWLFVERIRLVKAD
jgi:hypothetical protein